MKDTRLTETKSIQSKKASSLPQELPQGTLESMPQYLPERTVVLPQVPSKDNSQRHELMALPETCRDRAMQILEHVNEARTLRAKSRKRVKDNLKKYAESKGLSIGTLYRWLKKADKAKDKAEKKGWDVITAQLLALAPKYGNNKGNYRAWSEEALAYAKSLYLREECLNLTEVYRMVENEARVRGWQIGSYVSLKQIFKKELHPSLQTLARHGFKKYQSEYELKILRNYKEIWPNFAWVGDHHIFDVFVLLPDGRVIRPWLTGWLDMKSRSLMGWCISSQPNSNTIAFALAHGISFKNDPNFPQHGLPLSVYIDNGKDYRSKYLTGERIDLGEIDYPEIIERFAAFGIDPFYIDLKYDPQQNAWVKKRGRLEHIVKNIRVGGVYARLGIQARYATVYHPWAKPIERMFRNVVQDFSRKQPGWCGSGHEQRPEKLARELKWQNLLTFDEFCARFYHYVVRDYHNRPMQGHGMDGRTPNEVFLSEARPQEVDPVLLNFALLKKENIKIYNWGFRLLGRDMELDLPYDAQGAKVLTALIGSRATVYYDPELKMVQVYFRGRLVCNAKPLQRASMIRPDDEVLQNKLKLQANQRKLNREMLKRLKDQGPAAVELAPPSLAQPEETNKLPEEYRPILLAHERESCGDESQIIYLSERDRYIAILHKLASGKDLSPEDQHFKTEYESGKEFQSMKPLYEEQFQFMKYQAGRATS